MYLNRLCQSPDSPLGRTNGQSGPSLPHLSIARWWWPFPMSCTKWRHTKTSLPSHRSLLRLWTATVVIFSSLVCTTLTILCSTVLLPFWTHQNWDLGKQDSYLTWLPQLCSIETDPSYLNLDTWIIPSDPPDMSLFQHWGAMQNFVLHAECKYLTQLTAYWCSLTSPADSLSYQSSNSIFYCIQCLPRNLLKGWSHHWSCLWLRYTTVSCSLILSRVLLQTDRWSQTSIFLPCFNWWK